VLEYIGLPGDSPQRQLIERRFGRKHVLKLVEKYEEEEANKRWLQASTTACPGCSVSVEKNLVCRSLWHHGHSSEQI
jgi:E3 ubiquitin-protein ligase RNF14